MAANLMSVCVPELSMLSAHTCSLGNQTSLEGKGDRKLVKMFAG